MQEPFVITNSECTGCYACHSVCRKNAIEMKSDERGFLVPIINYDLCIGCKLCQRVCPLNSPELKTEEKTKAYAAYANENKLRLSSSSGGLFSCFADCIISNNGAVYGAVFSEEWEVIHGRTTDDFSKMRTSKYVQSRIGDIFCRVQKDLESNMSVLFTGTPCQVAGLNSYLKQKGIDTNNLFTVDIICHGVPSPMLWKKHLYNISNGKRIKNINFRDKRFSWGGFSLTVSFDDLTEYSKVAGEDGYMRGFFANMTLRNSCYACKFKSIMRESDITIADYWGVEKYDPDIMNEKGTSAVIIHSDKGRRLFENIKEKITAKEVDLEHILRKNMTMVESVKAHSRADLFWQKGAETDFCDFEKNIDELLKLTAFEKVNGIIVKIKRTLKKILKTDKKALYAGKE